MTGSRRRHGRPRVEGDNRLGPIRIPQIRECVACHYKPVPMGSNCPNCGRNELGEDAGLGAANTLGTGKTARQLQETEDWV